MIDYYRRRVMVPVRNGEGRVIGLIGRYDGNAKADGAPKYMNPPRTAVYDKAAALYRPSTPRLDPDGQVVVVEGTIDALAVASAAARAGFSSKFAPLVRIRDRSFGLAGRAGHGDPPPGARARR